MHIQPVKHAIEVDGLATIFHPLNDASDMVAPESHAHQFLDQLTVGVVSHELRVPDHDIRGCVWWRIWKRGACGRESALSKVRHLRWIVSSPSFTIIHHVCTRGRKRRVRSRGSIAIPLCTIRALDLLRWELLWRCSASASISKRHGVTKTSSRLRNS